MCAPQPDDTVWLHGDDVPGIVVGVASGTVSILWPSTSPLLVTRHDFLDIARLEPWPCGA